MPRMPTAMALAGVAIIVVMPPIVDAYAIESIKDLVKLASCFFRTGSPVCPVSDDATEMPTGTIMTAQAVLLTNIDKTNVAAKKPKTILEGEIPVRRMVTRATRRCR